MNLFSKNSGTVDYFSGAANKNIGDAFLLV